MTTTPETHWRIAVIAARVFRRVGGSQRPGGRLVRDRMVDVVDRDAVDVKNLVQ